MSLLRKYFILSRPRFWFYTLGPFMIGITAAVSGFGSGVNALLSPYAFIGFLYFGIFLNLLVYGVNDYFDADVDIHSTKKRGRELVQHAVQIKNILLISLTASLLYIVFLPNLSSQFVLIITVLLGVFYSTPPLRFKTKIFLDSFSNGFYILPGVIGFAGITSTSPSLLFITAAWLWTMGMHLFSAIPDIQPDRQASITTTATFLGRQKSLLLTSIYWTASTILASQVWWPLLVLGSIYIIMPMLVYTGKLDDHRAYWLFPYINTLIGFTLFGITLIK